LILAALAGLRASSASEMEYVTLDPPTFEACMGHCDTAADICLAIDTIDENAISLCEETKLTCYHRCAAREAHRRSKEAGHSLTCTFT
jgi:16S rRNA G966 N2-methylase RsmD